MESPGSEVTLLLREMSGGNDDVRSELYRQVERELRTIANKLMRRERPEHTLQPTVLVDDAFMRLVGDGKCLTWNDRRHFFRTAARAMKNILIDHARKKRLKRTDADPDVKIVEDTDVLDALVVNDDLEALGTALDKLEEFDPRRSEVIQLHHFGGLTLQRTAEVLGVSVGTVKRDFRIAKAWLYREIQNGGSNG